MVGLNALNGLKDSLEVFERALRVPNADIPSSQEPRNLTKRRSRPVARSECAGVLESEREPKMIRPVFFLARMFGICLESLVELSVSSVGLSEHTQSARERFVSAGSGDAGGGKCRGQRNVQSECARVSENDRERQMNAVSASETQRQMGSVDKCLA